METQQEFLFYFRPLFEWFFLLEDSEHLKTYSIVFLGYLSDLIDDNPYYLRLLSELLKKPYLNSNKTFLDKIIRLKNPFSF